MTPEHLADLERQLSSDNESAATEVFHHIAALEKAKAKLVAESTWLANAAKAHLNSINEFGHADPEWTDALYRRVDSMRAVLQEADP